MKNEELKMKNEKGFWRKPQIFIDHSFFISFSELAFIAFSFNWDPFSFFIFHS